MGPWDAVAMLLDGRAERGCSGQRPAVLIRRFLLGLLAVLLLMRNRWRALGRSYGGRGGALAVRISIRLPLDCCAGRGGGRGWSVGGRCIGGGVGICGIRGACGRVVGLEESGRGAVGRRLVGVLVVLGLLLWLSRGTCSRMVWFAVDVNILCRGEGGGKSRSERPR